MSVLDGYELWRDCIRWLVDVNVLFNDHKVAQPSATIEEFAALLRDGVLLCHLINQLVPNTIDPKHIPFKVHHLSEFQCEKIICLFLDAAQKVFLLDQADLFVAWELYCMTDFMKVLKTLSCISKSNICKRLGKRPFPYNDVQDSILAPLEEEEIYKNLQEKVEIDNNDFSYRPLAEEDDKIYDHFVARQDSVRSWENDSWSSFQPVSKREHSIKELLDTEKNYVEKALNMIMTKFHAPLKQFFNDPKDHEIVFMNIAELWTLHQTFYIDLQHAVFRTLKITTNDIRPPFLGKYIGDVFLQHKEKFIAYGRYCMLLDDSRRKLIDIERTDSVLRAKIHSCTELVNDNQFKLQDLLCIPMQRVLKYHLLLKEMLKATLVESPDRNSLEQAKDAMEDLSQYVNEMKRDYDDMLLIKEVERSIIDLCMPADTSLLEYGRLNTDCEVKVSESIDKTQSKQKNRHVFLFDKVLFICQTKRGNVYSYKGAYLVHELSIEHTENRFGTLRNFSSSNKYQVHLLRETSDKDKNSGNSNTEPVRYITLSFKNANQMDKWITQFHLSRDNVFPQAAIATRHKAKFRTFLTNEAHFCSICNKFLKGQMFQGYSCDCCGGIFHKACLGLRSCLGKRLPSITANASFSVNDNSYRKRIESFDSGEHVMTINRSLSLDPLFLNFEKDDVIEVVQSHDDRTFRGRHLNSNLYGLVRLDDVRRIRVNSLVGNFDSFTNPNVNSSSDLGTFTSATRIDRKESTILPRRPLTTPTHQLSNYQNTNVLHETYYVGEMPRQEAESKLKNTVNGTFLVRFSTNQNRYAISISYMGDVKHTIVEERAGEFFFDEVCKFPSIVELINYYRKTSLSECFELLNTELREPYRECRVFCAIHDYDASEGKFLRLRKGDIVHLIDTTGEERGWWKGRINDGLEERVGFFPKSYVEEYNS